MAKDSPFTPQGAVNPSLFVGRLDELDALVASLKKTRSSTSPDNHRTITGSRGIGKTSLLRVVTDLATGVRPYRSERFRFLALELELGRQTTGNNLLTSIGGQLRKSLDVENRWQTLAAKTWDFLKRFKVAGVEYKFDSAAEATATAEVLLEGVSTAIAEAAAGLTKGQYDGILITIDECDRAEDGEVLGEWLRRMVERVRRLKCNNLLVLLAGLPSAMEKLRSAHESAPRVFLELTIDRLDDDDVREAIELCFTTANRTRSKPIKLTDSALDLLVDFSDGYPHFLQTFGDVVWNSADDAGDVIDDNAVLNAATDPVDGAIVRIGHIYDYKGLYETASRTEQRILKLLAGARNWRNTRSIRSKLPEELNDVGKILTELAKRGLLDSRRSSTDSAYRIQDTCFAYWIQLFVKEKRKPRARRDLSRFVAPSEAPKDIATLREVLFSLDVEPEEFADLEAAIHSDEKSGDPYGAETKAWLARMASRSAAGESNVQFDAVVGQLPTIIKDFVDA